MARRPVNSAPKHEFLLKHGSLQDRFLQSRAKVQIYGGGFGNGKTTAACIKALQLADQYPGSTGLIARSTYPKLNDTIRKEFIKWCPPNWITNFPTGQNGSNICELKNSSTVYFRYIQQQGATKGESTSSNLLSATYDWIIIDQIEDPEITHKDFLDLFGRLRGRARYIGEDATMPASGPRWMMLTCNPTGNWVYSKIVRPYQMYRASGLITDDLLCMRDMNRQPILGEDGKPIMLLELIEGSTYELRHVHEADGGDFIQTLETMYQGQQRDRYLMGTWAAYEGLVYPQYNALVHTIPHGNVRAWLEQQRATGYEPRWLEGYDYGLAQPSCYILGLVTPDQSVVLVDGFYQKEMSIELQIGEIKRIRAEWAEGGLEIPQWEDSYADPSIFARRGSTKRTVGKSVASMFLEDSIQWRRGNNDIINGIVKVGSYLNVNKRMRNPFTGELGSPRLYVSDNIPWWSDECGGYFWQQSPSGDRLDKPQDKNDHAMDATKYILSRMPEIGSHIVPESARVPSWMLWHEGMPDAAVTSPQGNDKRHRYG